MQSSRTTVASTVTHAVGYLMTVLGLVQDRFQDRFQDEDHERGATAVEYGLLVGLIAIVIIVGVSALGGRLQEIFATLAKQLGG